MSLFNLPKISGFCVVCPPSEGVLTAMRIGMFFLHRAVGCTHAQTHSQRNLLWWCVLASCASGASLVAWRAQQNGATNIFGVIDQGAFLGDRVCHPRLRRSRWRCLPLHEVVNGSGAHPPWMPTRRAARARPRLGHSVRPQKRRAVGTACVPRILGGIRTGR